MYPYSEKLYSILKQQNNNSIIIENELLSEHSGNIAFYLSYPKILTSGQLKQFNHNIIVHASKLPQGKGWSPTSWQILEEKNIIPISLFEANEKIDNGNIYLEDHIELNGTELITAWRKILAEKILEMCLTFLSNYPQCLSDYRQPAGKESFYPKRTPKDSQLDITKTISEQFNLLRIVDNDNYPAFFIYNGKKYIIKIYEEE